MSEDSREVQSKHDRPAAGGGLLKPAAPDPSNAAPPVPGEPTAGPPAVPPQPTPEPTAGPPIAPPDPTAPPPAVPAPVQPAVQPHPPSALPPPPLYVPPGVAADAAIAPDDGYATIAEPEVEPDAEDAFDDDSDLDDEDEHRLTFAERLRRLPPALVILTAVSVGSLIFLLLALTSHTTPVPVLMSAGVVTGLSFGADAVISSVATWKAANDGESGQAVLLAVVGGISYIVSFGAFAVLVVMVMVLNS